MTEAQVEVEVMQEKNKVVKNAKPKTPPPPVPDPLNPVTMRLGESLRQDLEEIAKADGVTLSELCRELVEQGVNNNPERQRSLVIRSLALAQAQLTRARDAKLISRVDGLIERIAEVGKRLSEGKSGESTRFTFFG